MSNPPEGTIQWWKNGDHPDDDSDIIYPEDGSPAFLSEGKVVRRYRHPDVNGYELCGICAQAFDVHGWIDGEQGVPIVHPGDWVTIDAPWHTYRRDIYGDYPEVESAG